MEKDFFLDSFNELGNPKYPSFLTYLRNSVDRTVYAVYKNPTDKELDRVRRIEKRYHGDFDMESIMVINMYGRYVALMKKLKKNLLKKG